MMTKYFHAGTPGEWLQADLRTPTTVTGVVTQGSVGWRVTSFKISFGDSNNHLQVIQDVDGNDIFSKATLKTQIITCRIYSRYQLEPDSSDLLRSLVTLATAYAWIMWLVESTTRPAWRDHPMLKRNSD
ncbi:unnamed protein product [Clavelina lepadiformis]|uniref:F5/8 type C domain-containing protein n=1 Tax=Clavelina lepadiformis TaxID=159417 RepID=A0ABP0EZI0_CLALP